MSKKNNSDPSTGIAVIQEPLKMKGSKFVILFVLVGLLVAAVFSYGMYQSFLTRPKIKMEPEVK